MFGYSFGELGSILAMQGFAGLILFSVYLLMALGLAIIFGQMGVINMAHGEFMILGAYMTYFCSHLFAGYLPSLYGGYFFVAMVVAFIVSGGASAEDIKAFVNERVGKTQRLADVRLRAELPRSHIGKVLKRELRDSYSRLTDTTV